MARWNRIVLRFYEALSALAEFDIAYFLSYRMRREHAGHFRP